MATRGLGLFEGKGREADAGARPYAPPMINRTMGASEWSTLLLLGLLWGGAFFLIDVAVAEVAPLTFVWVRLSIAAATLWLFLWATGQLPALPRGALGALVVLALLNNAVPFTLFAWAQTRIDGGLSSILNATSPIWTVLVAHLFTADEKMTPSKVVGVLLGFGGVATMIAPDLIGAGDNHTLAQLAALVGALCYAFAGVWARRFRVMQISPTTVAAWQLLAAAAIMAPVALIADRPWTAPMPSLPAWGAIFGLAIVCSAFAYILYFRLIERAGATNALLVTLLTPPIAIVLAATFLDEQLGPQHFAGLGLIALGLVATDGRLFRLFSRSRQA